MQGIPKTYKFKKCDFNEFSNVLKSKNAELTDTLVNSVSDAFPRLELKKGLKLLIYKNNKVIGYLGFIPYKKLIGDLEKYYKAYIKKHPEQIKYKDININNLEFNEFLKALDWQAKENDFDATKIKNLLNRYISLNKWIKPSHNTLYVTALEIFDEFRSINTIKVVFNYIKQLCIKNHFDFVVCHAKDKKVARVYQMGGFKPFMPFDCKDMEWLNENPPMFLNINQTDYYEVTEKLKNKYKKNLFENMKDTKKLYEHIMTSVAKEVKKAINEGEDYNEEIDIQGDTERWCDVIDEYLWNQIGGSADANTVLALFSTLVYLDQLDDEEVKDIAEAIMEQIDNDEEFDNPPVDEVFFEAVAEKIKDSAEDWCADVVRDWKLNQ